MTTRYNPKEVYELPKNYKNVMSPEQYNEKLHKCVSDVLACRPSGYSGYWYYISDQEYIKPRGTGACYGSSCYYLYDSQNKIKFYGDVFLEYTNPISQTWYEFLISDNSPYKNWLNPVLSIYDTKNRLKGYIVTDTTQISSAPVFVNIGITHRVMKYNRQQHTWKTLLDHDFNNIDAFILTHCLSIPEPDKPHPIHFNRLIQARGMNGIVHDFSPHWNTQDFTKILNRSPITNNYKTIFEAHGYDPSYSMWRDSKNYPGVSITSKFITALTKYSQEFNHTHAELFDRKAQTAPNHAEHIKQLHNQQLTEIKPIWKAFKQEAKV